jgi:hypothetical protein
MLAPMPAQEVVDKKPFDTLHTLLSTARELAKALASDPELERLVRAFRMFPERDREAILQVIEKDAAWRRIADRTDGTTGIDVRPNPHASLYVHVLNQVDGPPLPPEASPRDADVIRMGVEAFAQIIPLLFQSAVHVQWTTAARELARAGTTELRSLTIRLAREVGAIVAEVEAELGAATK